MTKRIVCITLALMMLLVTFVACKENTPDVQESETESQSTNDVVESESETDPESGEITLGLPDTDWNGRKYTMLVRKARIDQFGDGPVSFGSTAVEKAVYERNETVKTEYNVNIEYLTVTDSGVSGGDSSKGGEMRSKLDASALGGCTEYDAVAPDFYWKCETKGYFADLLTLDHLNFDAPWWWSNWSDLYEINGKQTTCVGWLTLDIVQGMEVVYFNNQILDETSDENLYQLVYDGKWTLDKMIQLSKEATYNVVWSGASDETGAQGDDYVHGTIMHYMGHRSFFFSLGGRLATVEEDG